MEYRQRRTHSPGKRKRMFTSTEESASPHRAGHYAGLHPEDTPDITTADVQRHLVPRQSQPAYEADEWEAGSHIVSIARRYNGIPMPDGVLYRQGNDQVYVHTTPIKRASRNTDAPGQHPPRRQRPSRRLHRLFLVGIAFLVMVLGYVGFGAFGAWWQIHSDDGTYGRPRTFQIDAVVGHADSRSHPSHFLAINLNRHVVIIEIPGGDISRSVIYSAGVLVGDGQDVTPITLSFADVKGDGRLDMIVHILTQTIVFGNNGTKFIPPSPVVMGEESSPNLGGT